MNRSGKNHGIFAGMTSAILMGVVPIFGKLAIMIGFSPLLVVVMRTGIATLLLFVIMLVVKRRFFYIYSLGLLGCFIAGFINGVGSILFYSSLSLIDASIGQLLYSFYPIFAAFWLMLDRQPINRITLFRLILSIPGVFLLLGNAIEPVNFFGALFMVGAAILYALHIIINQRILYEVPAPTVTFYTLLSMTITVSVPYLIFDHSLPVMDAPIWPVLAMAMITFLSRLTLFTGVKHLGGLQTAILGLGELLITVFLAHLWLGESFTSVQWIGAFILAFNVFLIGFIKYTPVKRHTSGLLAWLNPPRIHPNIPWDGTP